MLLPLFLFTRNGLHLELPETLEGCNATVAGWGSFHDTKCTTDERSPSQNERCVFPFEENIGSTNQQKKKIKYIIPEEESDSGDDNNNATLKFDENTG